MNSEELNSEELNADEAPLWTLAEENTLLLARELEWAEAYAGDYPHCSMGQVYADFLRWELVLAQADL